MKPFGFYDIERVFLALFFEFLILLFGDVQSCSESAAL
jgi:hypothetical protein